MKSSWSRSESWSCDGVRPRGEIMVGPKITIIGAGSFFTTKWIKDLVHTPHLEGGHLALVDIDGERLAAAKKMAEKVLRELSGGDGWDVSASPDRADVLPGSDYIINTIEVSGLETVKLDYEIPKEYGVDQCIGDTTGPGGIMKALRTVPAWLEILADAEELCPDALILNYTNPMQVMTLAAEKVTDLEVVGLCHSVQNTSRQLADYLNVPYQELQWECAGINHMSWFTRLARNGKNLYPELLERARDPEIYRQDPIRFEMAKEFGYFVTESSGHFSEYVPYFRKREDLIEEYCGAGYTGESGFYARNWPRWRQATDELRRKWNRGEEISQELRDSAPGADIDLKNRSNEYGSYIIEANWTSDSTVIHGNFPNTGLIDNLPRDGIVEVETLVDGNGFHPCHFGELPEQLAALNRPNMSVHKLTVDSILERDREKAIQAFLLDPLTAAVLSPAEIGSMARELFEAEKEYIPDYLNR